MSCDTDNFVVINPYTTVRVEIPRDRPFPLERQRFHVREGEKIPCQKPFVDGQWDPGTPCLMCDLYRNLWLSIKKKEEAGEDILDLMRQAREAKPIERFVITVIHEGEEKLLSTGKSLYFQICNLILESVAPAKRSWFRKVLESLRILNPLPPIELPIHLEITKEMKRVQEGEPNEMEFPVYHARRSQALQAVT